MNKTQPARQPYLIDIVNELLEEVKKLRKAVESANKKNKTAEDNANDQKIEQPKEKIDKPQRNRKPKAEEGSIQQHSLAQTEG